ncbi:MAG: hypothetical protein QM754_15265 [Tepidisphaeraceae bacterium]
MTIPIPLTIAARLDIAIQPSGLNKTADKWYKTDDSNLTILGPNHNSTSSGRPFRPPNI